MTAADANNDLEPPPIAGGRTALDSGSTDSGPLWVSVEGINGIGKTTAVRAIAALLGQRCVLLDELTDVSGDRLHARVIAALSEQNDPFLRTGHPVVETLALLALQVRKAERLAGRDLTGVEVVLEDRGVDTVAVYQAVILCAQNPETSPAAVARHVLADARRWRQLPDATLLLTGDPAVCARRFGDRIGRPLTPADLALTEQIDVLYRTMAAQEPGRYTLVEVSGKSREQSAAAVRETLATLLDRQAARAC